MNRLGRFEDYRFVGLRDSMLVYDCDEAAQFEELRERVEEGGLMRRNQMQTFAPDTLLEARNRGFRPR